MRGLTNIISFLVIWAIAIFLTYGIAILVLGIYLALLISGAENRADRALARVNETRMDGEQLIADAIQKRVFALWSRRLVIAITTSRIVTIKRGLLGGFTMQDIQWKDLSDVKLEENVLPDLCGSNLLFKNLSKSVGTIDVPGIVSDVASTIYAKAQHEEQAWEEKRRIRSMEEIRAAAGGVVVHTGGSSSENREKAPKGNRLLEEITKAKELLDMGAITDAEFQEMKSKILASS